MANAPAAAAVTPARFNQSPFLDGKGLPDRAFSKAELTYRQKLRDLPASADPKWTPEDGLTNVTWPTKPE